jgi:hypothetical protein
MNEQLKHKRFRGELNGNASRRFRSVTRGNCTAPLRLSPAPSRTQTLPIRHFHPARQLMICLGWLRLFQAIVADGIPLNEESCKR